MADNENESPIATSGKDSRLLKEMRDRFSYAQEEWRDIREEGQTDMRCVAGDPWDDDDRKKREDAGRPCLSLDELGQYVNQLINEVRQHKRAIQVTPTGNGANDASARLRADLIRQIEYVSNAQTVYTTGFENTVQRSYGFWRVKAQYVSDESFDQELRIEQVANPDTVWPDPDFLTPTGKDMRWAFVTEQWSYSDFKRRWPKAKVRDFDPDGSREAPGWMKERTIQVAEYWVKDTKTRTLLLLQPPGSPQPIPVFEDQLKDPQFSGLLESATLLKERDVEVTQIKQYLTNGLEILEKNDWPGQWIPLICCLGKVLWIDEGDGAKKRILSLVRLARDPYMLYCYYRTCEAELVGMTPKFPYFAYEGQLSAIEESNIQKSLHEPVALIKVRPTIEGLPPSAGPLPFPQRQPYEPPIQALEVGAEAARRAIQAAMGTMPLPTSAQRRNEKSGVALKQIEESQQQGSYHFIDHYDAAITRTGEILDDLLDHYYDSAREVTLRSPADDTRVTRINDQNAEPDAVTKEPAMIGPGRHDVTLSTGPSFDSEREAASEFADLLAQNPQVFPIVADLVVKLKNLGPIGDEIAERLKAMLPPQVQQLEKSKGQTPEMLSQQLQQLQQMLEVMGKELDAKTKLVETDGVKAQQNVALEQMKQQFTLQIEQMKLATERELKLREMEVKLEIEAAKLGSAESLKRAEIEQQDLHAHNANQLAEQELGAEQAQADMDRQAGLQDKAAERSFKGQQAQDDRAFQSDQAERSAEREAQQGNTP